MGLPDNFIELLKKKFNSIAALEKDDGIIDSKEFRDFLDVEVCASRAGRK